MYKNMDEHYAPNSGLGTAKPKMTVIDINSRTSNATDRLCSVKLGSTCIESLTEDRTTDNLGMGETKDSQPRDPVNYIPSGGGGPSCVRQTSIYFNFFLLRLIGLFVCLVIFVAVVLFGLVEVLIWK